ncbi:MAG: peptidylprolyl isomerase [Gammaproteobacteria bacterium]|nr:peptidylprolyl isomerase [Gammaproteobacteria bacterium]
MTEIIEDNKLVELNYKVLDEKTGQVLSTVEFPISYVHGADEVLAAQVTADLAGKAAGEIIEIKIDGNAIYGPRDENLVFTDRTENVPEEYREVGTKILMENEKGDPKEFVVTRFDEETLTVDGNNPLCGRDLLFVLEVLSVREATEAEIEAGTKVDDDGPDIDMNADNVVPI